MSEQVASRNVVETLDVMRIMEMIPHRYPFLLIDRVVDLEPDVSAVGVKNVTINEQYFQGHFPRRPVMPGVLIIECMAQTAAVLVAHSDRPNLGVAFDAFHFYMGLSQFDDLALLDKGNLACLIKI